MSKPVRIKEYLAVELEKIAARENRSLANLVNKLLEQALEMDHQPITKEVRSGAVVAQTVTTPAAERQRTDADAESRDVRARTIATPGSGAGLSGVGPTGSKRPEAEPPAPDDHFKPDFKTEKKRK